MIRPRFPISNDVVDVNGMEFVLLYPSLPLLLVWTSYYKYAAPCPQ
jgi:hypothetical protein